MNDPYDTGDPNDKWRRGRFSGEFRQTDDKGLEKTRLANKLTPEKEKQRTQWLKEKEAENLKKSWRKPPRQAMQLVPRGAVAVNRQVEQKRKAQILGEREKIKQAQSAMKQKKRDRVRQFLKNQHKKKTQGIDR